MARLWDMLDAAESIAGFVRGKCLDDYLSDRMLRGAVERHLEIIGEAAKHVSPAFRDAHPEIPWKPIIAQRNVLTHEYGEIRHERIWAVCAAQLPTLIRALKKLGVEDASETDT